MGHSKPTLDIDPARLEEKSIAARGKIGDCGLTVSLITPNSTKTLAVKSSFRKKPLKWKNGQLIVTSEEQLQF